MEIGLPWKARELWLGLSSPFFDVEKVETPTLFLCGAKDANVPLLNSEQLYQALRRVGRVETELVVYPDQWHSIETPSYRKDRWERYLAWYDRYLRPGAVADDRKPEATSLLGQPLFAPEVPEETRKKLEENLAQATAEFVKNPDSADAAIGAGPPSRVPRPVQGGHRRLHAGPGEAPEGRAALPAPRPPLHHGARAGQGGRRPRSRRRARVGPPRRARARLRPEAAALDHAAVLGLLPPRPRPLPEGRLRRRRRRPTAAAWRGRAAATIGSSRRRTGST